MSLASNEASDLIYIITVSVPKSYYVSETDMATAFSPDRFSEIIRDEMTRQGMSEVRELEVALKRKTSARGTSYASVWTYVNGQAPAAGPRQAVIDALADIFGVLPEYLTQGGPRTPSDLEVDRKVNAASRAATGYQRLRHRRAQRLRDAVLEACGLPPLGFGGGTSSVEDVAANSIPEWVPALTEFVEQRRHAALVRGMDEEEAVQQLVGAIAAPLRALGATELDFAEEYRGLDRFILSMLPVLWPIHLAGLPVRPDPDWHSEPDS